MLINMTPNVINIVNDDGVHLHSIAPSGTIVTVEFKTEDAGFTVDDVSIIKSDIRFNNLPEYELGTFYIVSNNIKKLCPERSDFLTLGDAAVNEHKFVIGYKNLIS